MIGSQYKIAILSLAILGSFTTEAYTYNHDLRRSFGLKKSSGPSPTPFGPQQSVSTPQENMRGKKISSDILPKQQNAGLSQAAMNTDAGIGGPRRRKTSPLTGAAHGILSPEIVNRMDENTVNGRSNPAVENFLLTYKRKGPMSCLEMLSDPDVLPHLTQAMRDIV
mmetsp:Transcript_11890/g.27782  ORF Transcript_11890/g.27782 Transcript_11890/m.27782 type:complete len:166 (-) Transcript_11890:442-939(-)